MISRIDDDVDVDDGSDYNDVAVNDNASIFVDDHMMMHQ